MKKIIALSTLRQLGLIIIILCLGFYKLAFFHLLTHAIFKALLFICAGSIIHNIINRQDIRQIGGLCLSIPFTSSFFNIANLALCGIPFIAGFYSKDLILELSSFFYINFYIYFIFFFSTGLTVRYSFRLVYYSIVGDYNIISLNPINDEAWLILKRIVILVFISIIRGSILIWLIFPSPIIICLTFIIKIITLLVCLIGGIIGYLVSNVSLYFYNKSLYYNKIISFFIIIWFIPFISTIFVIKIPLKIGLSMKIIDYGWREYFGAKNLFEKLVFISKLYQIFHNNSIKLYLFRFILWILIIIIIINIL